MVVPDNDDDIIEDYETLPEVTSDTRRVKSAKGGPVERNDEGPPGSNLKGPQRDDLGPPGKGKVSRSTARTIWIVCILIILLGIGAVIADYQFNAFGRQVEQDDTARTQPVNNDQTPPDRELTPREKLEREFLSDVSAQMRQLDRSKAWDYYWVSILEFEDAYDAWNEMRRSDDYDPDEMNKAIAQALKHFYKAKYAEKLYLHRYNEDNIEMEYLPFNVKDLKGVPDEDLEDPRIRTHRAAETKLMSRPSPKLEKYGTDVVKKDPATDNVKNSEEWAEETFGQWMARYEAALKGEFEQEDLDFVNGDDYAPDEQRMFEKYLADKQE